MLVLNDGEVVAFGEDDSSQCDVEREFENGEVQCGLGRWTVGPSQVGAN